MSECIEYEVTYLSHHGNKIKGVLLLFSDKVVFEPDEQEAEKIEIPLSKIKDARLATEKDISALNVFLFGPTIGVLAQRKHKLMTIDHEDELGILKHMTFEGDKMEDAVDDLYEIRREEKIGPTNPREPITKRKFGQGQWQCLRCMRINAANAKFCTRCGEWRT